MEDSLAVSYQAKESYQMTNSCTARYELKTYVHTKLEQHSSWQLYSWLPKIASNQDILQ